MTNKKRQFLIGLLLMMAWGCVMPGFFTATPLPPAPTVTPDLRLPSLVAEKVALALTETMQALPPTSTPTATPEPPTSTPTITPTRTVGSALSIQPDGSTLFTDERAGYTALIPEGWLMARVGQPEFADALTAAAALDAPLLQAFADAQTESPDFLRLFAIYTREALPQGEAVTTLKLILDETRGISFNSDQDLRAIAAELGRKTLGLEVTSLNILTSPAGMQFGIIETQVNFENGATAYEKRVYFKSAAGLAYAWLRSGGTLKLEIFPAFDAIMDTVRPLP